MYQLPWLELSILIPLLGALVLSRFRDPNLASRYGIWFTGITFGCTFIAWLDFYQHNQSTSRHDWELVVYLVGRTIFQVDQLSAPLIPLVALLHFLTTLATARTKMGRFRFAGSLVSEAILIATFSSGEPWILIVLLIAGTIPPYAELLNRRKPTRVYVIHMALFIVLLLVGGFALDAQKNDKTVSTIAAVSLLLAVLLRCGTIPLHCWITDLFEHSAFGTALLFVAPLTGVYAAVHLVLPIAPEWALRSIGLMSLATALYGAGLAVVQREARRFFACLFLSHTSLVLVGLELLNSLSLTGALCLWFSMAISLGGFGLTLRSMEARYGRLALTHFHGLYEHSPTLAACFLLTGLASVGFPGTMGFVSADLLVDGAVEANLSLGLIVVITAALNGIAVVRAYFLIFTGTRHASTIALQITLRERIAVITLAVLILGGGIIPQPGVTNRHLAAIEVLRERKPNAPDSQSHAPHRDQHSDSPKPEFPAD